MTDPRLYAPATERNREPIRAALAALLPPTGTVLEIASGSGEHAVYLAGAFPDIVWRPSDPDPDARASIAAHGAAAGLSNLRPPLAIDACDPAPNWPKADAVFAANMIHIAPWKATPGLLRGAAGALGPGGSLILYGPFKRGGRHTALSNEAFDDSLRARDPSWGVRDLDDVARAAAPHGIALDRIVEMPANNLIAVFRAGPESR